MKNLLKPGTLMRLLSEHLAPDHTLELDEMCIEGTTADATARTRFDPKSPHFAVLQIAVMGLSMFDEAETGVDVRVSVTLLTESLRDVVTSKDASKLLDLRAKGEQPITLRLDVPRHSTERPEATIRRAISLAAELAPSALRLLTASGLKAAPAKHLH